MDAVISDAPHPFKRGARVFVVDSGWTTGDGRPPTMSFADQTGDDVCRISLTSGTTGDAKAVAFSHDLLMRRIARFGWAYGNSLANCSRIFVDPSLSANIGILFWLYALTRGGTVFFRGKDAIETMQAFGLYNVQAMVAAPAALAEFVGYYEQMPTFPARFDLVVTAGSLLSKPLADRVQSRLCSNLVSAYGSAEAHSVAIAPSHAIASTPGAVGYVAPDMKVEILDYSGATLPPGQEGLIRIRSEVAADGYLGDPLETEKAFRNGWFYPGDLGKLTEDGMLIISGREKTVINLGGEKINPERLEQALTSFPGIAEAAAFSVLNSMGIEELCAAVVSDSFRERELRVHCERTLAPEYVPTRFVAVNEIPKNEMGKIDRLKLAKMAKLP